VKESQVGYERNEPKQRLGHAGANQANGHRQGREHEHSFVGAKIAQFVGRVFRHHPRQLYRNTTYLQLAFTHTRLVCCAPGDCMTGKTSKLAQADYERLAEFRWSLRQFLRFSEAAARAAGISPQHHQALLAIKGFPGRQRVLLGELAERLQIQPHSAVGLANRLVAKGYIKRARDRQDRRRVFLVLTARGEDMLEELSLVHQQQLRAMGPQFARLLRELA
jgi:DNA-binding MarR family transcriptional regulator